MEIELIVEYFQNDKAVLKTKEGENIIWPKNKLPGDLTEGDVIKVFISKDGAKTAKDIINEIINTEE